MRMNCSVSVELWRSLRCGLTVQLAAMRPEHSDDEACWAGKLSSGDSNSPGGSCCGISTLRLGHALMTAAVHKQQTQPSCSCLGGCAELTAPTPTVDIRKLHMAAAADQLFTLYACCTHVISAVHNSNLHNAPWAWRTHSQSWSASTRHTASRQGVCEHQALAWCQTASRVM
jgi:hypothetical protein